MGFLTGEIRLMNAEEEIERITRGYDIGPRLRPDVKVETDDLLVEVQPHPSEGSGRVRLRVRNAFGADARLRMRALPAIAAHLDNALAAHERGSALEAMGIAIEEAPPWSFLAHPVAVATMVHHMCDPNDLGRIRRGEGRLVDGWRTISMECEPPRGKTSLNGRARGCVAHLHTREGTGFDYSDAGAAAFVSLVDPIPEAALTALVGRRIGDLLGAPAFTGLDVNVVNVNHWQGRQIAAVGSVLVPLTPAPEGVGTAWLRHRRPHRSTTTAGVAEVEHRIDAERGVER